MNFFAGFYRWDTPHFGTIAGRRNWRALQSRHQQTLFSFIANTSKQRRIAYNPQGRYQFEEFTGSDAVILQHAQSHLVPPQGTRFLKIGFDLKLLLFVIS